MSRNLLDLDSPVIVLAIDEQAVLWRLGRSLRRRRRDLELSQAEAGSRIGWTPSYWGQVERGDGEPRIFTLVRMVQALEWPPSELGQLLADAIDGRGESTPPWNESTRSVSSE